VSVSHLEFYQACHRDAQEVKPGCAGADRETVARNKHDVENEHPSLNHGAQSLGSLIDRIEADFESQGTETGRLQLDEMSALNNLYRILVVGDPLNFHILQLYGRPRTIQYSACVPHAALASQNPFQSLA
jgi:hypothetical protein